MHIYAIADLHLSGTPPTKPMEIFGEHWAGHREKIQANWLHTIKAEDYVIIAGDISWAMHLEEATPDLEWLSQLPGRKILLRGNHDYWWSSLKKMRELYGDKFIFLQNDSTLILLDDGRKAAVCGTRGWILPSAEKFTEEDNKIYQREGIRMELGLQQALKEEPDVLIQALHYPPFFSPDENTVFSAVMEKYRVNYCVYGHIHGENHVLTYEGERAGIQYKLVSCDTQNFSFYKIL